MTRRSLFQIIPFLAAAPVVAKTEPIQVVQDCATWIVEPTDRDIIERILRESELSPYIDSAGGFGCGPSSQATAAH